MFKISEQVGIARLVELSEILNRPFPEDQIEVRDGAYDKTTGGKKQLSYVNTGRVIERMNEAFGLQWTSEILSEIVHPYEVVCKVRVRAKINDEWYSHDAYGGKDVVLTDVKEWVNGQSQKTGQKKPLSIADDSKAAFSDALKVACKQFCVALHLYLDKPKQVQQPTQGYGQNQAYMAYQQPQQGYVQAPQPQQYQTYQNYQPQQPAQAPPVQYQPQPPFPPQPTYNVPPTQPPAQNTQPVNAAQLIANVQDTMNAVFPEVNNMG